MERTLGWLSKCRAILVRYEKKAANYLGMVKVACILLVPFEIVTKTARKARGLEATLVDRRRRTIEALDDADGRAFEVAVAGPAALMVAKLHKISERIDIPDRSEDKDALDVLRLLRGSSTEAMADGVHTLLNAEISASVTEEALIFLQDLFSEPSRSGCQMAARAAAPLEPEDTIAASCAFLTQDLLRQIGS